MVRLTKRMFALDFIVVSLNVTMTISEFPMKTKMPIIAKNTGTNILTILYIIS